MGDIDFHVLYVYALGFDVLDSGALDSDDFSPIFYHPCGQHTATEQHREKTVELSPCIVEEYSVFSVF